MLPKMHFENNEASRFPVIKCHYDDLFRKIGMRNSWSTFRYTKPMKLLSERSIKWDQT